MVPSLICCCVVAAAGGGRVCCAAAARDCCGNVISPGECLRWQDCSAAAILVGFKLVLEHTTTAVNTTVKFQTEGPTMKALPSNLTQ